MTLQSYFLNLIESGRQTGRVCVCDHPSVSFHRPQFVVTPQSHLETSPSSNLAQALPLIISLGPVAIFTHYSGIRGNACADYVSAAANNGPLLTEDTCVCRRIQWEMCVQTCARKNPHCIQWEIHTVCNRMQERPTQCSDVLEEKARRNGRPWSYYLSAPISIAVVRHWLEEQHTILCNPSLCKYHKTRKTSPR